MFVFSFCFLLATRSATAVVNNGATSKSSVETTNTDTSNTETKSSSDTDLAVASTEAEANKREAIISLSDNFATAGLLDGVYGPPIDSYLPSGNLNVNLPLPVYGAPNIGPNIIYPAPPPDVPPQLPVTSLNYGVPNPVKDVYGPPKIIYGPPKPLYGPPKNKPIRSKLNLSFLQRPPKPISSPAFYKTPKPVYGPPRLFKPIFNKIPKIQYGPPKILPKPTYGPPKQVQIQTTTVYIPPTGGAVLTPPISGPVLNPPPIIQTYGVPNINFNVVNDGGLVQPAKQYGPPEPVPHGPPPGVASPPTPPEIKYDGWQPIPGLVSKAPSDLYGVPNDNLAGHGGNYELQVNSDLIPPPAAGVHSLSLQESYKGNSLSDSYAAPLNTVTGSGGVIATSGEEHHQQSGGSLNIENHQTNVNLGLSAIGLGGGQDLSVIKSVDYELYPNYALGYGNSYSNGQLDTYASPPLNSYSPNGPYPAAQSFKSNTLSQTFGAFNSNSFGKEVSLSTTGAGLIPPSGVYGVMPSTQYGTPLFQTANLKLNPPKRPVVFREPVPVGLIQSIGNIVAQKDASGIIDAVHSNNVGATYIPPPVPEITKPVTEIPEPSNLYSLPHIERPKSFQNVVHGSSSAGLSQHLANSFNGYNFDVHSNSLGAYALPLQTSDLGFRANQNQQQNYYSQNQNQFSNGFDYSSLTGGYGLANFGSYQNLQHDCSAHNSQLLPQLNYGLPFDHSSLNANYHEQPALVYGTPDLQASHSQSTVSVSGSTNQVSESTKDTYAKSLGESFARGGELIQSQSLDLNNIQLQGNLGKYTLQIQSADGLGGGSSSSEIPHEQVLNDGLLQSILAAIEQQQPPIDRGVEPVFQAQPDQSQAYSQIATAPADLGGSSDLVSRSDGQSDNNKVEGVNNSTNSQTSEADDNLRLIDDNGIALYFNNNSGNSQKDGEVEQQANTEEDVKNAQQYGSYVSFKTPDASYNFGDLKLAEKGENVEGS